jgi:acetyltransferase-like isoleucine patch superfamily enzyme
MNYVIRQRFKLVLAKDFASPKVKCMSKRVKTIKGIWNSQRHPYMNKNKRYSKYSIGEFTYGEPKVVSWGEKSTLKIGKFCSIADGVQIVLGGEHKIEWVTTYPFWVAIEEFYNHPAHSGTKGDVVIGNDVWIGLNSMILSGVTIGDGAVIGAGTLVSADVEPYSIVVGNPQKLIRKRFDEKTIEQLLMIKWWDWDISRIKKNMPLLLSEHLKEFIEKNRKEH